MHDPVFDIFCEEAREHLRALEKGFLDLELAGASSARRSLIDALFRHAHSLKGDSRAVGLTILQNASQQLEDILDAVRSTPEMVNREVIDQGLAQLDKIRQAFEVWQRTVTTETVPTESTQNPKNAPPEVAVPPAGSEESGKAGPMALPEESFTVRVPSERLDRMLNLAGELRIVQRSGQDLSQRLTDLNRFLSDVLERCQQLEHVIGQGVGKADSLHLVRTEIGSLRPQLEGCRDQVGRIVRSMRTKRNREDLLLETLEADIQQARLLPLVMLADSMRRAIRDLGQSLTKEIRYEVDVGNVLLDKAILEALRDPMLHLLRNAASHGIESPEERKRLGKPQQGVIRLQARRHGKDVRILISDDGAGVAYDRIRARVRQTEGLSESELGALSAADLVRYLFKPGFTTADTRDPISGRGVGLDVVLTIVHRLHGKVALESSSPQGTTFAITVPVSISTIRIVTVLCDGQYFGIPSNLIETTGRARSTDLRQLENCSVLPINGEPVRWVTLMTLLGGQAQKTIANGMPRPFIVIHQQGRPLAVAVDELEEESEVLLKPLGFPLNDLPKVVGAAVRPDGSVQIVLDLSNPTKPIAGAGRPMPESNPIGRILVVDDSPTTRTILRNVLSLAGYSVKTASDGIDALERLRVEPVDLVISDVEMPRMDGFELTRRIKAKLRLPVILVTGLEKEEHRRKGLEAGADAYVVKSTFQGDGLLTIVKQFV
ncbi:MAG TPA: response regulator [Gemmataceae bacterium]|nr:response regulator [Gemmataceae bacterium]